MSRVVTDRRDVQQEIERAKREGRYDPAEKPVIEVVRVQMLNATFRPPNNDFCLHAPIEIDWSNIRAWDLHPG